VNTQNPGIRWGVIDMEKTAGQYWDEYVISLKKDVEEMLEEVKEEDRPFLQQCLKGVETEVKAILSANDEDEKKRHLANLDNYRAIAVDHQAILSLKVSNLLLNAVTTGLSVAFKAALGLIAV
jgi:signal transduction protein with GAF and PtsI domain